MDMNFNDLQNAVRSGVAENNSNFRTIDNAICTLGYQNAQLINGVQMQVANEFRGLDNAICTLGFNTQSGFNSLANQLASCCCDIREGISGINYNMAINSNALQASMCNNTRDIIDSQVNGTRAILDAINANRIEDKNAQIQAQQNEINALRLSASQAHQNEYLLNQLRTGCPVNAQLVCGNQPIPVQYIGAYGNNCGCGCGNNF